MNRPTLSDVTQPASGTGCVNNDEAARAIALAGIVGGPLGRLAAFVGDLVAALWRTARGDPRHPEERKVS